MMNGDESGAFLTLAMLTIPADTVESVAYLSLVVVMVKMMLPFPR